MITITTAEAAFERLKRELLTAKLADKNLIQDLQCREAHRRTYAKTELVRTLVTRKMDTVEIPLESAPKAAPTEATLWDLAWPPASSEELIVRKINLPHSYEIINCPTCSATGRTSCGVCRGSGQTADPNNPRKAVKCETCRGQGVLTCKRCKGHSKLNRFAQIIQTVTQQKKTLSRPSNALGIPKSHLSGRLIIKQPLGFRTIEEARNSILKTAVGLNPECVEEFSREMRDPDSGDSPTRLGFLNLNATWHDGWELQCVAGGRSYSFFVPDTAARFIGPRLHSRKKLAWLGAAALGVLLTIGAIINYQVTQQREARELARITEEARVTAEKEARIQALKSELPTAIQEAEATINGSPDEQSLITQQRKLERFRELNPAPPELIEKQNKLTSMIDEFKKRREADIAATDAAVAAKKADKLATTRDWGEADDLYNKAIDLWDKHLALLKTIKLSDKDGKMIRNAEIEKSALEKKQQRIAPQVAAAKARIKARMQEADAKFEFTNNESHILANVNTRFWGSYKINQMLFPDEEWEFHVFIVPRGTSIEKLTEIAKVFYSKHPKIRARFFDDNRHVRQYVERDIYINDTTDQAKAVEFPDAEWVQNHLLGNINNRTQKHNRRWILEDRNGEIIAFLP